MQFVDYAEIDIASGAGGDGKVAWRREKYVPNGGPAGGDGGHGASVYLEATEDLNTLLDFKFRHIFKADDGQMGQGKNCFGKAGKDLTIYVPVGTVVKDTKTDNIIGDLSKAGDRLMVAAGGRGGRGNARFNTAKRQAPHFAEPGEPAIERKLALELKLLADVGLVGLPNAGKSTLISTISAARPKIADYPFTTLVPNLGVVKNPSGGGVVVADIPGLIEGASDGVGLGHDFLRHVERNRLLLHLIDISQPDLQDPIAAYRMIRTELANYSERLATKSEIIVLTKIDTLPDEEEITEWVEKFKAETSEPVYPISAVTRTGLTELLNHMMERLQALPKESEFIPVVEDVAAYTHDDSAFEVVMEGEYIIILGGKVERLMRVTDFEDPAATRRLYNIFKAMGVIKAIEEAGAKKGQSIVIGTYEFEYLPENDDKPFD